MADLSKIKPASEVLVDIKHPVTGDNIGVTVSIISVNDDRMKALKRQIQDRRINLERKGKSFKAEDIEDNGYDLAFRAMTGWEWGVDADGDDATFHGKKPEFEKNTVIAVFKEIAWFHEQIMEAISDDKRFFSN